MPGRVIKGQNNLPVARIMACVEVVMQVGPVRDLSEVSAFVNALLDWPMGRVTSVSDNRDFFQLRAIEPSDIGLIHDAMRVACDVERHSTLYGTGRGSLAAGDEVAAVDVGRPGRVYRPSGSREWLVTAGVIAAGAALLLPAAFAAVATRHRRRHEPGPRNGEPGPRFRGPVRREGSAPAADGDRHLGG